MIFHISGKARNAERPTSALSPSSSTEEERRGGSAGRSGERASRGRPNDLGLASRSRLLLLATGGWVGLGGLGLLFLLLGLLSSLPLALTLLVERNVGFLVLLGRVLGLLGFALEPNLFDALLAFHHSLRDLKRFDHAGRFLLWLSILPALLLPALALRGYLCAMRRMNNSI